MGERPVDQLLLALREHDISLTRDDVQWAFDSAETNASVTQWVERYLGPETLLSKEELETFSKIERSGAVKRILASNDLSTVRPVLEDDLRNTIETLNASTAAIERQNELLAKQRESLEALKERNRENREACNRSNAQRRRKHAIESQHVALACDELAQNISSQLAVMQQQMKTSTAQLPPAVAETLRADDRLLARLERLASELDLSEGDDGGEERNRIAQLGKKAASLSAEEIRLHLDTVYLETLVENATGRQNQRQDNDASPDEAEDRAEINAIKAELNSLYQEIGSLTEISVQENYLRPIFDEIKEQNKRRRQICEDGLDYISSSLEHLITRLDAITNNTRLHHAHHAALLAIAAQAEPQIKEIPQNRITSSSPSKPQNTRDVFSRQTSSFAAAQSTPLKGHTSRFTPNFPSTPTLSFDSRMGTTFGLKTPGPEPTSTGTAAMQQLFRRLGLHISPDLPPAELAAALSTAVAERKASLRNHLFTSEMSSFTPSSSSSSQALINASDSASARTPAPAPPPSALAKHLAAADATAQILLDAVYADSKHCNYTLVDDNVKTAITKLEQDVDAVGKGMAGLDLETVLKEEQKPKERFVERWAGM
ncbi:hypothetical protein L228DRAFT_283697 [Xylona heveae TC161]|uniref:HAUS augmin-like complex subunit 3 N-terminal domain-containing protein n=1 Tax=Xylona heveae (strain CBS 132557 / TC161) TaxID=1328760 RepID=A0A165FYY3_XYLHT|nr:hypothetical protein L228DRAFT_283697 [Xylona heveae TC161]KZF21548.1 hypothetical protein L228DRAFT_283697 [Xylona heveae TC161]